MTQLLAASFLKIALLICHGNSPRDSQLFRGSLSTEFNRQNGHGTVSVGPFSPCALRTVAHSDLFHVNS